MNGRNPIILAHGEAGIMLALPLFILLYLPLIWVLLSFRHGSHNRVPIWWAGISASIGALACAAILMDYAIAVFPESLDGNVVFGLLVFGVPFVGSLAF